MILKSKGILHDHNIIATIKIQSASVLKLFIFERSLYSTGNSVSIEPRLYFYFLVGTELQAPYEPVEMRGELCGPRIELFCSSYILNLLFVVVLLFVLFCLSYRPSLLYSRTAHFFFFFKFFRTLTFC